MFAYLFDCMRHFTRWQSTQYEPRLLSQRTDQIFENQVSFVEKMTTHVPGRADDNHHVRTAFFSDVLGFGSFNELEVKLFFELVLPPIATILDNYAQFIEQREGWGDAINLVFNDPEAAVQCGLEILELLKHSEQHNTWASKGLNRKIEMRIALETAPLLSVFDPIEKKMVYTGNFMTRAARIEPIAEPNTLYCGLGTFLFCNQQMQDVEFNYLGILALSKKYGGESIFSITAARNQSSRG